MFRNILAYLSIVPRGTFQIFQLFYVEQSIVGSI